MGVLDAEKVRKIKQSLRWHPRGMTISDLSSAVKMNRNLLAKYLDMLLVSGEVEMQLMGAAKVYYFSRRVPVSAMLEFSSDLVIMIDDDQRIHSVNEQVPVLLGMQREALVGRRTDEIASPFIRSLPLSTTMEVLAGDQESSTEFSSEIGGEDRHFRTKTIPTSFENGKHGITLIIDDITAQKKYQTMLEISEAKYRGMVQSSGEAIIGNDPGGRIISWNPAAEHLFGYTEDQALGKEMGVLGSPDQRGELGLFLEKVGRGEYIRQQEMKMVRNDGTAVEVLMSISPIRGEHDSIIGASSIIRDITSEKREKDLRDHEDRYRKLVEDINVGIYRSTGDRKGHFVWGNTALLDLLGYHSFSDLKGIDVIDIFSEPDGRKELLDELKECGFVKNRILHLRRKDGRPITVLITALAEFDVQKKLKFINGIVQDISWFIGPGPDELPAH